MEFYANAVKLRTEINAWLLRDFGIKERVRELSYVSKKAKMLPEDADILSKLFDKYSLGDNLCDTYPEWWVSERRRIIDKILSDLVRNIVSANSIYPVLVSEYEERRKLQNSAICCVYSLIEELQFTLSVIWRTTGADVEKYMPYIDMCENEIALIKGWRKSDNKILTRLKQRKG